MTPSRASRFALWALLGWCAAVGLGVLLLEGGLRLAGRDPVFINPLNSFHRGHPVVGWLGVPGLAARFVRPEFDVRIVTGPDGFRESGARVVPGADAVRVSFLGDSFTWGWGGGQGEVVTDPLQDAAGPGFAILNRGLNAWGTVQQALLLEELVAREPPDAVAVMFFRNDFANNLDAKGGRRPYLTWPGPGESAVWHPVRRPLGGWWRELRRRSAALTLLAEGWNRGRARLEGDEGGAGPRARPAPTPREVRAFEASLARIRSICWGRCALVVVYIADPSELDPATGPSPIGRAVAEVASRLEIDFIDLLPVFRGASRPEPSPLYFPQDQHWTARGHALAAAALAPWVQARGLAARRNHEDLVDHGRLPTPAGRPGALLR